MGSEEGLDEHLRSQSKNDRTHPCHDDTVCALQLIQLPKQEAAVALQSLPFVDHQTLDKSYRSGMSNDRVTHLPSGLLLEDRRPIACSRNAFIGRYEDMELGIRMSFWSLVVEQFKLLDDISRFAFPIKWHYSQLGSPSFEFSDPVSDRRVWHHNQDGVRLPFGRDRSNEG